MITAEHSYLIVQSAGRSWVPVASNGISRPLMAIWIPNSNPIARNHESLGVLFVLHLLEAPE